MNFALLSNLIANYQNKSLLKSSELHAIVLMGVAAAAKAWVPNLPPVISDHVGELLFTAGTYAALRVSSKLASAHATAPKIVPEAIAK